MSFVFGNGTQAQAWAWAWVLGAVEGTDPTQSSTLPDPIRYNSGPEPEPEPQFDNNSQKLCRQAKGNSPGNGKGKRQRQRQRQRQSSMAISLLCSKGLSLQSISFSLRHGDGRTVGTGQGKWELCNGFYLHLKCTKS